MYNDGLVGAIILGVLAMLLPVVWIAWWLIADLGERATGTHPATRHQTAAERLRRAA